ncbi:hypothetical protein [Moorena sp. SIO3H5]|uniref:hypothetical protein n=1 Tax=Moorena sp. SIO3H5 TaxID=2607834 RepID=UPI0025CF36B4|nr:hypothetical protein [Moorena sp. SIO3H5]
MVVETEGKFTSGMSLADLRDRRDEATYPPNVEACLDVDTDRFLKLFYELIERTSVLSKNHILKVLALFKK